MGIFTFYARPSDFGIPTFSGKNLLTGHSAGRILNGTPDFLTVKNLVDKISGNHYLGNVGLKGVVDNFSYYDNTLMFVKTASFKYEDEEIHIAFSYNNDYEFNQIKDFIIAKLRSGDDIKILDIKEAYLINAFSVSNTQKLISVTIDEIEYMKNENCDKKYIVSTLHNQVNMGLVPTVYYSGRDKNAANSEYLKQLQNMGSDSEHYMTCIREYNHQDIDYIISSTSLLTAINAFLIPNNHDGSLLTVPVGSTWENGTTQSLADSYFEWQKSKPSELYTGHFYYDFGATKDKHSIKYVMKDFNMTIF